MTVAILFHGYVNIAMYRKTTGNGFWAIPSMMFLMILMDIVILKIFVLKSKRFMWRV